MDSKSVKKMIASALLYSFLFTLCPLLILGLPAYWLDRYFQTKPIIFLVAVFCAFIITNILLFKQFSRMNSRTSKTSSLPTQPEFK
jgi:hypothetical protein